jgi:hypothetical protein
MIDKLRAAAKLDRTRSNTRVVMLRRLAAALALVSAPLLAAPAAVAQDVVLVERVSAVSVTRAGEALVVLAVGSVPIAGFTGPMLRVRPDLAQSEGAYVLDFVANPPPRDKPVAQVETRIAATLRIEPPAAATILTVQVRAARDSRTVQVTPNR